MYVNIASILAELTMSCFVYALIQTSAHNSMQEPHISSLLADLLHCMAVPHCTALGRVYVCIEKNADEKFTFAWCRRKPCIAFLSHGSQQ